MITFHTASRRQAWLALLVALAAASLQTSARAAVLMEDAGDAATMDGAAGRWEAMAVSSARSGVSGEGQALTVKLAPGDHGSFSRATDLAPAPLAVLCRFNVSLQEIDAGKPTAQVFRLGWGFGNSNGDEPDARTYAKLGLATTVAGDGFQLRDLMGGSSAAFHGTQAISWALNNSGQSIAYAAPNGTIERVANDRMDVWVGRTKVFDDVAATNPAGRITDLKWFWSQGSGVTRFDHFEIRTLEEATEASARDPLGSPVAALNSEPAPQEASIALERPTPNPFTRTTRYAYAIPDRSAAVDIGVFDLAGRRIRMLAHGVQASGQYEVRWDGLGDDGVHAKHGIYFLRAAVGAQTRVSRLVYLSE